jgi:hypothetical protein
VIRNNLNILASIIFILIIIWLVIYLNKKINEALIKVSEKLNFNFEGPKNLFKRKYMSGTIEGYKCEINVYTRKYGESSTTYVSFFTYFPESLNMGIKINWRGEFEGDDNYLTSLFIERNSELIEKEKKKLRRLKITDTYVNSRKVLFKKYYNPENIIKTMNDVVSLTKKIELL